MAEGPLAEAAGGSPVHEFEAGCGAERCYINVKIDNPRSADGIAGAVSLGNFYLADPVGTEAAVRSVFLTFAEVIQAKVLSMTYLSSILVKLCCHTKESFLEFIDAFEAKTIKQRLREELFNIGFKDELEVTFENEREVYENLNLIRFKTTSTLIGILVDVSGSMESSVGGRMGDEGGKWAKSIFKVVDELIKHDVSPSNQTFALAVGGRSHPEVFDLLSTIRKANQEVSTSCTERAQIEDIRSRTCKRNVLDEALTILERNGAPRVRRWGKMEVLLKVVDDTTAAALLHYLQKSRDFVERFVLECLPRECREFCFDSIAGFATESAYFLGGLADKLSGSNLQALGTEGSVKQAIEEGKRLMAETRQSKFQLVDVSKVAIKSVQRASEILHASTDEHEVTDERVNELLKAVEPYIYGSTPLMQAIRHSVGLFSNPEFANHQKMLFILSDGKPSDEKDPPKDEEDLQNLLRQLRVTTVSCFITKRGLPDPRHLYSILDENWEDPAKFMFRMSSIIKTQEIPHSLFAEGWKIDNDNNETRLFFQVNHPDLIKDVCKVAKECVSSKDTLSGMLSAVDVDLYINQSNKWFGAKKQDKETCYANAAAAVVHLATKGIVGRDDQNFFQLRDELITKHGEHGARTKQVLEEVCPKYGLKCEEVYAIGAMRAVSEKRPVVARFFLSGAQWDRFHQFYEENPKGILTRSYLDSKHHSTCKPGGHAVVLTSYDAQSLRLMNSWGDDWADHGFFRVQNANVLPRLKFFDVSRNDDMLSREEKEACKQRGAEIAAKLMRSLQGLQAAKYKCPLCDVESKVVDYSGHLLGPTCPSCRKTLTVDKTGDDLALNLYLTSLMH